jgi:predicted dehydrogenase
LDYRAQEGYIYRVAREGEAESALWKKLFQGKERAIVSEFGGRKIVREPVPIEKDEPLKLELRDFIKCIKSRQTPLVSGAVAQRSLDLAFEITRQIQGKPRAT